MTGVADGIGNMGSGSASYNYTLDTVGPVNSSVGQVGGSFLTMPDSVTFMFSGDIDMSTVTAADFSASVTGLCNPNPITGVVVTGNTVTLSILNLACILNSTIKIDLAMTGVKDQVGNPGVGILSNTYKKVI